jgi:hypothetical protein
VYTDYPPELNIAYFLFGRNATCQLVVSQALFISRLVVVAAPPARRTLVCCDEGQAHPKELRDLGLGGQFPRASISARCRIEARRKGGSPGQLLGWAVVIALRTKVV